MDRSVLLLLRKQVSNKQTLAKIARELTALDIESDILTDR